MSTTKDQEKIEYLEKEIWRLTKDIEVYRWDISCWEGELEEDIPPYVAQRYQGYIKANKATIKKLRKTIVRWGKQIQRFKRKIVANKEVK